MLFFIFKETCCHYRKCRKYTNSATQRRFVLPDFSLGHCGVWWADAGPPRPAPHGGPGPSLAQSSTLWAPHWPCPCFLFVGGWGGRGSKAGT